MSWTCDDTNRAAKGGAALPDQALAHVSTCELCQELTLLGSASTEPDASPASDTAEPGASRDLDVSWAVLEQSIAQERGLLAWLRHRSTAQRTAAALVVALAPAATQVVFALRADIGQYPAPRFIALAILQVLVIGGVVKAQLLPLYVRQVNWQRLLMLAVGLGVPLLLAILAPAHEGAAGIASLPQRSFAAQAFVCLRYGLLLAAPCVLLMFAFDRQVARSRTITAALAAVGGLVGNLALFMHCPIEDVAHRVVGHASIGFVVWGIVATAVLRARRS
jgi:hypothetical protein